MKETGVENLDGEPYKMTLAVLPFPAIRYFSNKKSPAPIQGRSYIHGTTLMSQEKCRRLGLTAKSTSSWRNVDELTSSELLGARPLS
ncbi:hypothetical protein ACA30_21475 [Virgibacillus soli]|nr:hypothetical protein ACA30_21475 [Virgibacillus soli]